MPDYEFTLSRAVDQGKVLVKSVILENYQANMAVPAGIKEIMAWGAEEIQSGSERAWIPQQAIDYWDEVRKSGAPLMDIQTKLQDWGLTFSIKPYPSPAAEAPTPLHVAPSRRQPAQPAPRQRLNLKETLAEQLKELRDRQKELRAARVRIDEELEEINDDSRQIVAFLTLSSPEDKKAKKTKAVVNA
jgi:hypothetical protein